MSRGIPSDSFLLVVIAGQKFALPVGGIRNVVRLGHLTPVPRGPATLLGLMDVEGDAVPVFDIRPRLANTAVARLRVVRFLDLLGGLALAVDEVIGVFELPLQIAPLSDANSKCAAGTITDGAETYLFIDLAALSAPQENNDI